MSNESEVPCRGCWRQEVSVRRNPMSVRGVPVQWGPMSKGGGFLYSEIQCTIGNGHMGPPLPLVTDWWTDMTGNITSPQLCWWAVIMPNPNHSIKDAEKSFEWSPTSDACFCNRKFLLSYLAHMVINWLMRDFQKHWLQPIFEWWIFNTPMENSIKTCPSR